MKRTITKFFTIILLLGLCACNAKENAQTWEGQYNLGEKHLSEGNYEEAIAAFTKAIEIDPTQVPAYIERGEAYILEGKTAENLDAAQADYEKAIELDDSLQDAYIGLAEIHIQRTDYDKALDILSLCLEKTSDSKDVSDKIAEVKELANGPIEDQKEVEGNDLPGNGDTIIEGPSLTDIQSGYWESNGYRLSDICVYHFQADGTFMMQMGMSSIPTQGRYEYTGQTLTLFYRDKIDDILSYDTEKQIFVSSQKTVLVEQALEHLNPEGTDKFAAETLSFLKEPPDGFFEDEPTTSGTNTEQEANTVQPPANYPNVDLYPMDYIGMTIDSLSALWGNDYLTSEYQYAGAARPIYYSDNRVALIFYFLDPEEIDAIKGTEKIELIELTLGTSSSPNEVAPGIPAKATYSQLNDLIYSGELVMLDEGDSDGGETAIYYMEYSTGICIHYSWFNYNDPETTPAEAVMIWAIDN